MSEGGDLCISGNISNAFQVQISSHFFKESDPIFKQHSPKTEHSLRTAFDDFRFNLLKDLTNAHK